MYFTFEQYRGAVQCTFILFLLNILCLIWETIFTSTGYWFTTISLPLTMIMVIITFFIGTHTSKEEEKEPLEISTNQCYKSLDVYP